MALCVAMLIASEFMPVSLLTPIAADLHATEGMAGQAISISGLFAVLTSVLIATIAGRFDRRHVLMVLTAVMLASLVLIAQAPNFAVLMVARALLLRWLPLILGVVTRVMLAAGRLYWPVAIALVAWGTVNSAIPVAWSTWLSKGISDEPESGGGLLVGAIQLAIMSGGTFGGVLLDHFSIAATMIGGTALLIAAAVVVSIWLKPPVE